MEINIKVEGLNQLTEALALIGSALAYQKGMTDTAGEAVNLLLDVTDRIEDLTQEQPEDTKEEEKKVVKEGASVTIEEVRAAFMAKNNKGNTEKLKSILNDFGVKKVTDLEEKDFTEVLKRLEEI